MNETDDNSVSKDFLIAEFNALQERAMGFEEIKSGRINFFLIIVAATIAGLSSLPDNLKTIYPSIVLAVSMIVFLLGVSTLKSVMDYSIAIVILFRKAGRIRRWFVNNDSNIEKYIPFEPNDDRPRIKVGPSFIGWRGGEPILLITNATAISAITGVIASSYLSLSWTIISAIMALIITWAIQVLYMNNYLQRREISDKTNSLYPTSEAHILKKPSSKKAS